MRRVVVGLGSNLGAREALIRCACDLLGGRERIAVRELSTIYETEPLGPSQPDYLNAAVLLETDLPPRELLGVLLRTERRLGRHRTADERWGPRSIDLDLLWDESGTHESPELRVPHPELCTRAFALGPLLELAPFLVDEYGSALEQLGGLPKAWGREAIVRGEPSGEGFERHVEADSLADACALSVRSVCAPGRPWSTWHLRIEPGPEHFGQAIRHLYRRGFSAQCTSVSDCSPSHWDLEFHGVNMGIALDTHVGLRTTSGGKRAVRAELSVGFVSV